jgi:chromosome segregation ATPase
MNKLQSIINELSIIQTEYSTLETEYNKVQSSINKDKILIDSLSTENKSLKSTIQSLTDELTNLKKVSLFANYNKQIVEKDNYICVLEKRIELLSNRNKISTETIIQTVTVDESPDDIETDNDDNEDLEIKADDEDVEEGVEGDTSPEEPEIEYQSIKIGKKYYYVSNENPQYVYEVIKSSNDVGDKLGVYNKDLNKIEK